MKDQPCAYCGTRHERHEDAACGCGCGSEPMGCAMCMQEGGPSRRYTAEGNRFRPEMVDDASDFDDEGW